MTSRTPSSRLGAFGLFLWLGLLAVATAAPVKFDIPAQAGNTALQLFGRQATVEVLFPAAELKKVQTAEVKGELEPRVALDRLLAGTGFAAEQTGPKNFIVKKADVQATTGSVRGSLTGEGGKGVANVFVSIRETAQSSETDRYGVYSFPNVAAGTYVLVASAPGYQPMHITDVSVKAGRDLLLGKEEMRKSQEGPLALEPFVVHADTVEQLEKFEVTGTKQRPYEAGNMDIPRTIDDVQPYTIFDSKTIEQSGAVNTEDFLKQRLTMNSVSQTNGQVSGPASVGNLLGNTSSINLRGLGTNETLVLIDGRRVAGVRIYSTDFQPDLNGIPISAIERIEVLPSSASGIYGGSAVGGVVNIILKKNYVGGEIRATYDNTFDTDSPRRSVSASYGMALEGGKTHLILTGSWSDSSPLLLQDRLGIFQQNIATIRRNSPSFLYSATNPFLGALPNIVPSSSTQPTLTLKNGTVLPTRNTFISAVTSPTTSAADLYASLTANAGNWDFDLPDSTQSNTGLLRRFGVTPTTKSFQASLRRQMTVMLELFADYTYSENNSTAVYNPLPSTVTIPISSPINPFTTAVKVRLPDATQVPAITHSTSPSLTLGAIAHLPFGWVGEFDYTWSQNRFSTYYTIADSTAMTADLASGAINPFVDSLRYPLNLGRYIAPFTYGASSNLNDFALRGSGALPSLPWGSPSLTAGLEHREADVPQYSYAQNYPISTQLDYSLTYYDRQQSTDSGYAEVTVPLLKKDWLPLVHTLDFQASGRSERYTVDSGTTNFVTYPNNNPAKNLVSTPNINGQPYFSKARYVSNNETIGLKYQPIPDLTFRVSRATAFLPPTPDQLVTNPQTDNQMYGYLTTITDPKTGQSVDVDTLSGGNPNVKPQNSKSLNVGVIWEPHWKPLQGLRLNAEYYKIDQYDAITYPDPQTIVNEESLYPARVTRDASGAITLVDTTAINLYKRETEGWDLSASYTRTTGFGTFSLQAAESIVLHLKTEYSAALPEYDAVNAPAQGGAAKYKANATFAWDWHRWTAAWTTRYFGAYKQYGAAGGPVSVQNYGGAKYPFYILPQGSDTIPSQMYHDVYIAYAFGKTAPTGSGLHWLGTSFLNGLSVQLGVRNVFDKVPPFDVYYSANSYVSPYGDMRLRSYWLSIKKSF